MAGLADWETEGARARPAVPSDRVSAPVALRATTWIGVLVLVAAVCVFASAASIGLGEDESEAHLLARVVTVVVVGAALTTIGAVALVLRLVAGVLVRR